MLSLGWKSATRGCGRSLSPCAHAAQGPAAAALVALWAASTAASRVALGRHYVADVLTGLCLGAVEYQLLRTFLASAPHFCLRK